MVIYKNITINDYWILVAPIIAILFVLYGWPVLGILHLSFSTPEFGLQNYADVFSNHALLRIILKTFRICLITTFFAVVFGYIISYTMVNVRTFEHKWLLVMVLISFWVSVLVRAFAWLSLLGYKGLVNVSLVSAGLIDEPLQMTRNELGVLIGMVHYMIPYAVLPILANMQGMDKRIIAASFSMGASQPTTFRRIYLPLTLPGIVASSMLVFIISLGFYITPALLGGGRVLMAAEYISVQLLVTLKWGTASVLATLILAGVFALMFIVSRFMKLNNLLGRP